MDYPTTHTSLSPIRRGFAPCFVDYKKGCTRLADASDKVYQLLAHVRWFSPGTPDSSTTKTGRHGIAEILLKVSLSRINQINQSSHITKEKDHRQVGTESVKCVQVRPRVYPRSVASVSYHYNDTILSVLF